eukprot:14403657-Alexandrium_andersonii.AAC.1
MATPPQLPPPPPQLPPEAQTPPPSWQRPPRTTWLTLAAWPRPEQRRANLRRQRSRCPPWPGSPAA